MTSPAIETGRSNAVPRFLFVCFIYFSVASAVFNGFYQKWGLRDHETRYSFTEMIEGTAHRPFVFRQLLPQIANIIAAAVPDEYERKVLNWAKVKQWFELKPFIGWLHASDTVTERYFIQYLIVYFGSFLSLFLAMLTMRMIALEQGLSPAVAIFTPPVFALSFQYFLSMGGFFYDFPELLFLALSMLVAMRYSWAWLMPVSILATANKESFLFYSISLLPILMNRYSKRQSLLVVLAIVLLSGATYLAIHQYYAGNPGKSAESWLSESLRFYARPYNYLAFETNWGIVAPRAFSAIGIALIAGVVAAAWKFVSGPVRQHALLVAAMNFPLVLIFCGPGEMRNFSLCYIAFFMLLAKATSIWCSPCQAEGRKPS